MKESKKNEIGYFEFRYPYYALIRAKNKKEAIKIYRTEIAEDEKNEEVKEVAKEYALGKFAVAIYKEDKEEYTLVELIEDFSEAINYVLLIDGELI